MSTHEEWVNIKGAWYKGRDFDRMIAAHALAAGAILVTANEADFRDIPGLELINWTIG